MVCTRTGDTVTLGVIGGYFLGTEISKRGVKGVRTLRGGSSIAWFEGGNVARRKM